MDESSGCHRKVARGSKCHLNVTGMVPQLQWRLSLPAHVRDAQLAAIAAAGMPERLATALDRALYVEHPMRTGGSGLCAAWCERFNCKEALQHGRNCRGSHDQLLAFQEHAGKPWSDSSISEPQVSRAMGRLPRMCGILMHEPEWEGRLFHQPASPRCVPVVKLGASILTSIATAAPLLLLTSRV